MVIVPKIAAASRLRCRVTCAFFFIEILQEAFHAHMSQLIESRTKCSKWRKIIILQWSECLSDGDKITKRN